MDIWYVVLKTFAAFFYFGIIYLCYAATKYMIPRHYNRKNEKAFTTWQKVSIIFYVLLISTLLGIFINRDSKNKSIGYVIGLIVVIPSLLGTFKGFHEDSKLTKDQRAQLKD